MITSLREVISGDIILSRSGTWLSRLIRWVTALQSGSSEYSHAAMATGDNLCIEALWEITISDLKKYEGQEIQVWRIPLSEIDRRNVVHGLYQLAGQNYGIMKLPLFAMDAVATQIGKLFGAKKPCYWFTEKFGLTNLPVCSQLVVYAIHKFTSYRLFDEYGAEVNWKTVSPDRLQDLLMLPQNKAQIV
jgi:hypothetical protein